MEEEKEEAPDNAENNEITDEMDPDIEMNFSEDEELEMTEVEDETLMIEE